MGLYKAIFLGQGFFPDLVTRGKQVTIISFVENFEKQWVQYKPTDKTQEYPLLKSRWLKFFKGLNDPGTELEPDHLATDLATRYFGLFCNITTMPCTAQEVIEIYGTRDLIEKTFKAGKSTAYMSVVRSHREDTAEGRFIISFVAMTILSRLYALMKKSVTVADSKGNLKTLEPLSQDMSFNELKNYLRRSIDGLKRVALIGCHPRNFCAQNDVFLGVRVGFFLRLTLDKQIGMCPPPSDFHFCSEK